MSVLLKSISFLAVATVLVVSLNKIVWTGGENPESLSYHTAVASTPRTVTNNKRIALDDFQSQQAPNPDKRVDDSLKLLHSYLADAEHVQSERPEYTAKLERHVVADDRLQDPETIFVKVRNEPFSVYLKWESDSQQVLYVDGENGNRLIAKPTNALSLIRRIWHLNPTSPHAMKGCRYPITELGINRLHERIHKFYQNRDSRDGITCEHSEEVLNDRPVMVFNVTFHSADECADYSSSKIIFDAAGKWIVGVVNNGWTSDGRPGELLEKYVYHDIAFDAQLRNADFSLENPEYRFAKN